MSETDNLSEECMLKYRGLIFVYLFLYHGIGFGIQDLGISLVFVSTTKFDVSTQLLPTVPTVLR